MKKTSVLLLSLVMFVTACKEKEQAKVEEPKAEEVKTAELSTDKEKLSYAIGYQFGRTLKDNNMIDELDLDVTTRAMTETLSEKGSAMTEEEVIAALTAFQTRKNDEAVAIAKKRAEEGVAFLEANKVKEGVVTTESGLQYKVITEGEGASPTEDSEVEVNYKGTLVNGDVFDSSYDRNQSATFPIGNVIPGFREGMMLMKEGGKSTLYIPAALAYGKQAPPSIGPDQTLIFEVELLKVK